jgi:hypothetical protein
MTRKDKLIITLSKVALIQNNHLTTSRWAKIDELLARLNMLINPDNLPKSSQSEFIIKCCESFFVDPYLFDSKLQGVEITKARAVFAKILFDSNTKQNDIALPMKRSRSNVSNLVKTANNYIETNAYFNQVYKELLTTKIK